MILQLNKVSLFLTTTFLLLTLSTSPVHGAPQPPTSTPGGLLHFTTQSFFDVAFLGFLTTEDFEKSPIAAATFTSFAEPLDNSTDIPGVFLPDDIVEDIIIRTVEGVNPGSALLVAGAGWRSNTSNVVGPNHAQDTLDILFTGNDVYAVSMDLLLANSTGTATITIYGPGGAIHDTLTGQSLRTTATYFGFYSPNSPITRISVDAETSYELVDNIRFGGSASSSLTFYTDQAVFEQSNSNLVVEDFEKSRIADDVFAVIAEPLNSSTQNAFFLPDDIVSDLSIQTVAKSDTATSLVTAGGSFSPAINNSSKIIATNRAQDNLLLTFPNLATYAVGMDLMFSSSDYATIVVYDIFSNFLGVTWLQLNSSSETFFGVDSKNTIGYIRVHNDLQLEFVDNIQFGGTPAGLRFYHTETDFKKARSNLPKEDFAKSGPVANNSFIACSEPVDSTSDEAGCFEPGDILPNIIFQTENSVNAACPACITLWGANTGTLGNNTPLLIVSAPDLLEIKFPEDNVYYVGMNLNSLGIISIYGPDDTLLGTAFNTSGTASLNFWGVGSGLPISRITIDSTVTMIHEIMFGGKFLWSTFMPAIINNTE